MGGGRQLWPLAPPYKGALRRSKGIKARISGRIEWLEKFGKKAKLHLKGYIVSLEFVGIPDCVLFEVERGRASHVAGGVETVFV